MGRMIVLRKIISLLICAAMVFQTATVITHAEETNKIYVSVYGSDSADGSIDAPLKSLKGAVEYIKNNKDRLGNSVNVLFHEGKYNISSTTEITGDMFDGTVTFMPYNNEKVVFSGAAELPSNKFSKVENAEILQKLPQKSRGNVMQFNLENAGLSYSLSDSTIPYIYVNDIMKTTARYPNEGHLKASKANGTKSFECDDEEVSKWGNAKDLQLIASSGATYFWYPLKASVDGSVITADRTVRKNAEFWAENLLEELDMPGEYFTDRENNVLYYYPDSDMEDANIEITSMMSAAVKIKGASNITFDGLEFDKFGAEVFNVTDSENINIKNCVIKYSQGGNAIYFSGNNSKITDNYFYGCANTVITFHGGELKTLKRGNVEVSNNRISMCGFYGRNSIISSGSAASQIPSDFGNKIENNIIQDCMTFMGISCGANDYTINGNEIINQGYYIGDGGAIYMGRSNTKYGTEAAYNYIHDGHKGDAEYAYCGLYSDDGYGNSYFHHNVISDMYVGMILNSGMNCRFNNNLMINNTASPSGISRMASWTPDSGVYDIGTSSTFLNEVETLLKRTSYGSVVAEHYPYLKDTLSRRPYFAPWDTEIMGNVSINCGGSFGRIWHPYYKNDGVTPVIDGEKELIEQNPDALFYAERYVGSNLFKGYIVDEYKLYGKKITNESGEDLNATEAGNPKLDYDDALFRDAQNGDYTLTDKFSSDVSTVNEIDMSTMSIVSTTNPNIYKTPADTVRLINVQNMGADAEFIWERTENASKYRLMIAKDSGFNDVVYDETMHDTGEVLVKKVSLEPSTEYFWKVEAYGIAKNNKFTAVSNIASFTTNADNALYKDSLNYAVSLADSMMEKYNSGLIEFSDSAIFDELKIKSAEMKEILNNAASQQVVDNGEQALLNLLVKARACMTEFDIKIKEVEADESSDDVSVVCAGAKPNTLVSVLVTNPEYDINNVPNALNLKAVQYSDTVLADNDGVVKFSFNTRVDGEDRSGLYTLYVKGVTGEIVSKTYSYGTVYAGAITYKNADGQTFETLKECGSGEVTMSCLIQNNTSDSIAPSIITAFYDNDVLTGVKTNISDEIAAFSSKTVEWKADVNIDKTTSAKVMFWDSLVSMKPLAKCRIIYESAK